MCVMGDVVVQLGEKHGAEDDDDVEADHSDPAEDEQTCLEFGDPRLQGLVLALDVPLEILLRFEVLAVCVIADAGGLVLMVMVVVVVVVEVVTAAVVVVVPVRRVSRSAAVAAADVAVDGFLEKRLLTLEITIVAGHGVRRKWSRGRISGATKYFRWGGSR